MSLGDVRTPVPSGAEYEELAAQFRYERAQLSEPRSTVHTIEAGVRVEDLSWQSPHGGRVPAWLVVPERPGPHAAVLFLHASTRDRDAFLPEARRLSDRGAVCLTITAAHSRPGHAPFPSWTSEDRESVIQDVIDLGQGLDHLIGRGDVDPGRLGFVGLSYGADYGAIFCAVDGRLRSAAFVSGGTLREWYARRAPEAVRMPYLQLMETVAPDRYLPFVTRTRLLFQNGREDAVYAKQEIGDFQSSVRGRSTVKWYDAGHWLNEAAVAERVNWLIDELALD
jgi:predicted esterase